MRWRVNWSKDLEKGKKNQTEMEPASSQSEGRIIDQKIFTRMTESESDKAVKKRGQQ